MVYEGVGGESDKHGVDRCGKQACFFVNWPVASFLLLIMGWNANLLSKARAGLCKVWLLLKPPGFPPNFELCRCLDGNAGINIKEVWVLDLIYCNLCFVQLGMSLLT